MTTSTSDAAVETRGLSAELIRACRALLAASETTPVEQADLTCGDAGAVFAVARRLPQMDDRDVITLAHRTLIDAFTRGYRFITPADVEWPDAEPTSTPGMWLDPAGHTHHRYR